MRTKAKFKVWKTITLGTGLKTPDDFRQALKAGGFRISKWADDLLSRFKPAIKKEKVDLVVVSIAELGLPKGVTKQQVYNRAKELGLDPCSPEVGPQLRLQYGDQPEDEELCIGMEPITGSDGDPSVFNVFRGVDGLWLGGDYGHSNSVWYGYCRWVFRK